MTPTYSEPALRLHSSLPVVEGHNDLPWKLRTTDPSLDPGGHLDGFHTDIPRMLQGGVGAQLRSVYVPADIANPFEETLAQIDLVERLVASDDRLEAARTGTESEAIKKQGRIASLIGAEGGHSIDNDISNVARLADRGVRYMTLTHSDTLDWADSATDDSVHGGLTNFGRDVVHEMNRVGILVDISHVSVDTMRDAIDASEVPVIASHSNAAAIAPHPRNIPDDVLSAVGDMNGVVMVNFFPGFAVPEAAAQATKMFDVYRRIRAEFAGDEKRISMEWENSEANADLTRGDVGHVVDHIEHIATVAGIDAVGLGSDFDGIPTAPVGLEDVSCYPVITDELLARGWSEPDILKVLGENSLRVLDGQTTPPH